MAVDERSEVRLVVSFFKGRCRGNQCCGQIDVYCTHIEKKCRLRDLSGRNRPVSATYYSCWAQANKLPDSMDAGEPISWPMRQDE